eukprot:TRINITY_DN30556_c0_g1_i1.p1 TRINITY_DN30556_c0_g1~~TRINITY_DN30556_c0_g1_i1.p1  ORF type:complete len:936 (+),score=410.95 TRINITY_DN30556_c0_g1_i1:152-2809(+)
MAFMTRGDLGPVSAAQQAEKKKPEVQEMNDAKFDHFAGYNQSLVRGINVTSEDKEAEKIYDVVDTHMEQKKVKKRKGGSDDVEDRLPTAREIAADLKPDLAKISLNEWENLPDPVSLRQKRRKKDDAPSMRVPDSVILSSIRNQGSDTSIPGTATAVSGTQTELRAGTLSMVLDAESHSVSGQAAGTRDGILTDLAHASDRASMFSDVKKMRMTCKAILKVRPKDEDAWVGLSRAERQSGSTEAAKDVIAQACLANPKSEEIWVEALSLCQKGSEEARMMARKATANVPKSAKLWTARYEQEADDMHKVEVLQAALEEVPTSEKLWMLCVDLQESAADAKELLSAAVENVPTSVDLWLAYVKLEPKHKQAKKILNNACKNNPTDRRIRVAAGQLEEAHQNFDTMETIMQVSVQELTPSYSKRSEWFDSAVECERYGFPATAKAIVFAAVDLEVDVTDQQAREHTYIDDAKKHMEAKEIPIARYIYAYALQQFPDMEHFWGLAAELEQRFGTPETHAGILQEAVMHCSTSRQLWLMLAKLQWQTGKADSARAVLEQAFKHLPRDPLVWVAAAKLEAETGNTARASTLLERARSEIGVSEGAAALWMKSAKLARQLGDRDTERELLDDGIKKFRTDEKLWLMRLQWEEWNVSHTGGSITDAQRKQLRLEYTSAIKAVAACVHIWIMASHIEEVLCKGVVKARALLEKARTIIKGNDTLWLASIRLELRDRNTDTAKKLLSKALQECPQSGVLWGEAISLEPAGPRKAKATDAFQKVKKNGLVSCAMARVLWSLRDIDRARKLFQHAVKYGGDNGDIWAFYYKFEVQEGTEGTVAAVLSKCAKTAPHYGELWTKISKSTSNTTLGGCRLSTEQILKMVAVDLPEYDEH